MMRRQGQKAKARGEGLEGDETDISLEDSEHGISDHEDGSLDVTSRESDADADGFEASGGYGFTARHAPRSSVAHPPAARSIVPRNRAHTPQHQSERAKRRRLVDSSTDDEDDSPLSELDRAKLGAFEAIADLMKSRTEASNVPAVPALTTWAQVNEEIDKQMDAKLAPILAMLEQILQRQQQLQANTIGLNVPLGSSNTTLCRQLEKSRQD